MSIVSDQNKNNFEKLFTLVCLGNATVGKSSLILRWCKDEFRDSYLTTIGIDFFIKPIEIENKLYKLSLWDTAGQERFNQLNTQQIKSASGIILVYSCTDTESFQKVEKWLKIAQSGAPSTAIYMLVATKIDDQDNRVISYDAGYKLAKLHNMEFLETSSKNNINIHEVFYRITQKFILGNTNTTPDTPNDEQSVRKSSITSHQLKQTTTKKSYCCSSSG